MQTRSEFATRPAFVILLVVFAVIISIIILTQVIPMNKIWEFLKWGSRLR
ncbi:MAG: hypothetical protein HY362_03770 [Candidatus Aenigmarchaeota archaeon]|nr:hypothetical protein [Candidatus Aenigmarchaeota archaeon]